MNRKQREDKYGAPRFGATPKKGVGQDGFRQARKDHRSDTDAAGEPGARASARAARESASVTPGISWANGRITINGMRLGPGGSFVVPLSAWEVAEEAPQLPVEHTVDAVQAWKVARLYSPDGRTVELGAVVKNATHPVEGSAECKRQDGFYISWTAPPLAGHRVPDMGCTCGYYAWKTRDDASEYIQETVSGRLNGWMGQGLPLALMQVELFGRVIQFEKGYRAETQRVLGVVLPPTCSALLCGKPAVFVDFPEWGRAGAHRVLCAVHKDVASITAVGVADIANALGCEVTWGSA